LQWSLKIEYDVFTNNIFKNAISLLQLLYDVHLGSLSFLFLFCFFVQQQEIKHREKRGKQNLETLDVL